MTEHHIDRSTEPQTAFFYAECTWHVNPSVCSQKSLRSSVLVFVSLSHARTFSMHISKHLTQDVDACPCVDWWQPIEFHDEHTVWWLSVFSELFGFKSCGSQPFWFQAHAPIVTQYLKVLLKNLELLERFCIFDRTLRYFTYLDILLINCHF